MSKKFLGHMAKSPIEYRMAYWPLLNLSIVCLMPGFYHILVTLGHPDSENSLRNIFSDSLLKCQVLLSFRLKS